MTLKVARNQASGMFGGVKFELSARVNLTPDESALISKYKADKEVLLKKEIKIPLTGRALLTRRTVVAPDHIRLGDGVRLRFTFAAGVQSRRSRGQVSEEYALGRARARPLPHGEDTGHRVLGPVVERRAVLKSRSARIGPCRNRLGGPSCSANS
jgi:hypothetical protein